MPADDELLTWRPEPSGSRYAIALWRGEEMLPYTVCRVGLLYESWLRAPDARGGFWGGDVIGRFQDPAAARRCCVGHWRGPGPG